MMATVQPKTPATVKSQDDQIRNMSTFKLEKNAQKHSVKTSMIIAMVMCHYNSKLAGVSKQEAYRLYRHIV